MTSHLDALRLRRSNEAIRLASAKTEKEQNLRTVWLAQIDKEIAAEAAFDNLPEMSDDELLAELGA